MSENPNCKLLKEQNKKLADMLHEVIDYSMSMEMATGYKTKYKPNMLAICRFLQEVKEKES
jgi:hypothetical protein